MDCHTLVDRLHEQHDLRHSIDFRDLVLRNTNRVDDSDDDQINDDDGEQFCVRHWSDHRVLYIHTLSDSLDYVVSLRYSSGHSYDDIDVKADDYSSRYDHGHGKPHSDRVRDSLEYGDSHCV